MKCSEFMQSLDAWTDGELSEEQSAEMERHANQCAPCREQWTAAEQLRSFLSRMDEDRPFLNMTDFSLSDAVYETAKSFVPIAAAQNKTFHINVDKNISFYGDEPSVRQAVSLLLDNAMRYSDSEGTVEISLKRSGRSLRLVVRNTADHLQPGKLDVFFERFYRADASRNSEMGGNGIGLSVVKAIVTAHKGKISAESPEGRWVNFTITF